MGAEYQGLVFERPGHSTVRIRTSDGTIVYIDPWSKVIDDSPGDADVVFITHDDRDHYDPVAIQAVSADDTVIAAYEEVDTTALNRDVIPLPYDDKTTVDGMEIRTVPAYNRPDGNHIRDNGEPFHQEGEVVGLVLTLDDVTIYFASDTDFLDVHRDIVADVLILPIGGGPTMDRHEAAAMAESIDPDIVLPVHYNTEGIGGIDADGDAFKEEVSAGGTRVVLF